MEEPRIRDEGEAYPEKDLSAVTIDDADTAEEVRKAMKEVERMGFWLWGTRPW